MVRYSTVKAISNYSRVFIDVYNVDDGKIHFDMAKQTEIKNGKMRRSFIRVGFDLKESIELRSVFTSLIEQYTNRKE